MKITLRHSLDDLRLMNEMGKALKENRSLNELDQLQFHNLMENVNVSINQLMLEAIPENPVELYSFLAYIQDQHQNLQPMPEQISSAMIEEINQNLMNGTLFGVISSFNFYFVRFSNLKRRGAPMELVKYASEELDAFHTLYAPIMNRYWLATREYLVNRIDRINSIPQTTASR